MNHLARLFLLLPFLILPSTLTAQGNNPVEELFRQSVRESENGNLEKAIIVMDSVIQIAPGAINAYWNLGIWYGELGNHPKALDT